MVINLSIPNYYKLKSRQQIIKLLANIYPQASINLVPQPLAALAGYFKEHSLLPGDGLVIDMNSSSISFVTILDTGEMTLELQVPVEGNIIAIRDTIKNQALKLGLLNHKEWLLDYGLILGELPRGESKQDLATTLAPLTIIHLEASSSYELEGLTAINDSQLFPRVSLIYPFDFYIQKYDKMANTYSLERLPFDTSTLELDLAGKYEIFSLSINSDYNLSTLDNKLLLKLYEVDKSWTEVNIDKLEGQEIIVELDLSDPTLNIINLQLDLSQASLNATYPDLLNSKKTKPLLAPLDMNQNWLSLVKETNLLNKELNQDLQEFLNRRDWSQDMSLDEQVKLIKFKLLTYLSYIS